MFTKDTRTETFLTQMGVDFRYTNRIRVPELRKGWNEENLARPKAVNEDTVLEYSSLMENGSPAPAPILFDMGEDYTVGDGVQRITAAILSGATRLSAYVVTSDSEDIRDAIRVLANARLQGRQETPEWTRRRAVEVLVVGRGLSVEEVARMGGWRTNVLSSIADAVAFGSAVVGIGGPSLPDSMLAVVAAEVSAKDLAAAPEPSAKFLQTVKDAKFSAADAQPHIEEFFAPVTKRRKRHATLSDRLKTFVDKPEVQVRLHGRKGQGLSHDVNLRRAMKTVLTVLGEIRQSQEPLLYVDEFFQLSGQIADALHELAPSRPKAASSPTPADRWSNG